ncbi:DUF3192 domain-containing protein [Ferrimonas marina]|uniref:DUF3192 domain-containing protein n=1 Tax=Ferrimonas marina TaxID=299255 RepID=A0A1M5SBD2_9GAMM|nr:DUF3192 domain-containing protein [Ferrimonas marina]SHH35775.1 Protein of unknown function [Ferrimonas marina]
MKQQGKSKVLPIMLGLLAAYLMFAAVVVLNWEPDSLEQMDWDDRQRHNAATIAQLEPGMAKAEVMASLGQPDFSEAHQRDGITIQVLRYRTHRTKGDGETTLDETTPLLFHDGVLTAWGEAALASQ